MVAYSAVFVGYFSTTSLSYLGYYQCNTLNYTPLKLYPGRFQNLPESTTGSFYIIPLGRSWGFPESTPTSQDLPPFRHLVKCLRIPESSPPFSKCICATLPGSIPPSQNTPLFSTTILCNPPRMYPSLPEYSPLFNTYISSPWYYTVVSNIFFKSAFMSDLKLLGAYASCIKFFNFTYGYK